MNVPPSSYQPAPGSPDSSPQPVPLSDSETPRSRVNKIRPLQAAALLGATFFLSRIIGLLQYTIINGFLPSSSTDAYYAAFRLPDIVNYLVAGGAISITFIPIFTQLKHDGRERDAWRFFSTIATLMGGALLLLIALCVIFVEPLVRWTNPGFLQAGREETLQLTIDMTRVLLPSQVFFYLGGLCVGVLNAHRRFGASGFTGAVYNGVAIIVGFITWILMGPVGFAWGIFFGALIGNFLLPLLAARSGPTEERLQYLPSLDYKQPEVQRFFQNALPIMLGVSLPVVDQVVVGWFASYLPTGGLTHLQTGNRVMIMPLTILAQAASVAAFPFMASDSAAQNWPALADFLRTGLRRLMFLSLPISVLLILNSRLVIDLLFGYGRFVDDPHAVQQTSIALSLYCIGLFAWAGQQFVARGFYALQDTVTPTVIGSFLTIFFFIPLCWIAARWGGVAGLALATSLGAMAHFAGVLLALQNKLARRKYGVQLQVERVTGTLVRTCAASFVMWLAGLVVLRILGTAGSKSADLVHMLIVTVVASGVFAVAAHRFEIPEWQWLLAKVTRRKRPSVV